MDHKVSKMLKFNSFLKKNSLTVDGTTEKGAAVLSNDDEFVWLPITKSTNKVEDLAKRERIMKKLNANETSTLGIKVMDDGGLVVTEAVK